nr:MAG TPA: hypothetical protein [Bacteriophage sp.]
MFIKVIYVIIRAYITLFLKRKGVMCGQGKRV